MSRGKKGQGCLNAPRRAVLLSRQDSQGCLPCFAVYRHPVRLAIESQAKEESGMRCPECDCACTLFPFHSSF